MGLSCAAPLAAVVAMSRLPAAVLRHPRSSPFPFTLRSSSSHSATAAVFVRLFGRSGSLLSSSSQSTLSCSSFSSAAPGVDSFKTNNSTAPLRLRLRRGSPDCGLHARSSFRTFATMSSEVPESVANNPGLHETPDEATKGYFLQQTMYRIKDPKVSLDFYTRILGMSLLKRFDFPENKFSLYFLGYEDVESAPTDAAERVAWTFGKTGTLELTHNWGTESDENFKGHHNGNSDPRGYGHIGITVDDTYKACERFEKLGVKFVKKPDDGKMKGLAFIQDPDGYWIEIFDVKNMASITAKA